MFNNDLNAGQFNYNSETAFARSGTDKLDQLSDIVGNMKLRAGLAIADAAQKMVRPSLRGNGVGAAGFSGNAKVAEDMKKVTKGIEETAKKTKELGEVTKKTFGGFNKTVKETSKLIGKQLPKNLEDFGKVSKGIFDTSNTAVGNFRKTLIGTEKILEKLATATFITKTLDILVNSFTRINDEVSRVNSSLKIMNKSGFDPTLVQSVKDFENAVLSLDFNNVEEFATSFVAQYNDVTTQLTQVGTLIPSVLKKASAEGKDYLGDLFDSVQNMVNGTLKNTVSSSEAIAATYTALQAGIGGGEDANAPAVQDAVKNTLKLISTQGGDANQVMELLVQTMTAFNMSANSSGEILGKLNELVNVGITSIPELAQGYGQLGVGASRAGVSFDDLNIAMAALTLSGSNTFSAMTNLQNVFNKIASGSVTERLAEMGATLDGKAVRFDTASVSVNGFQKSVEMLNKALGGSAEKIQQAFGGDQEAVKGISAYLTQTAEDLKSITETITNAGVESLEKAFNIKIDNDKILQFEQTLNRVSEIALKLGKILAPLFSKGLDRLETHIDRIDYLIKNYGNLIVKFVELNLALKTTNAVIGVFIGTIGKLAGAYLMWLTASGKLMRNLGIVGSVLTKQNKALGENNILWDKNTSMFKKILAVIGQLIGFYDLEKAGKVSLTKEEEKRLAIEARTRAVQAAAHNKTMEELKQQQMEYEKINQIREGKSSNRTQNIFNEQQVLDNDTAQLKQKRDRINQELNQLTPNSPEYQQKLNELRGVSSKIEDNDAIKRDNDKKILTNERQLRDYNKLKQRDPNNLTEKEKKRLAKYEDPNSKLYDYSLARRARDFDKPGVDGESDNYKYKRNLATEKYIDANRDKPDFKRRVNRELGQNSFTMGIKETIDDVKGLGELIVEATGKAKKGITNMLETSTKYLAATVTTKEGFLKFGEDIKKISIKAFDTVKSNFVNFGMGLSAVVAAAVIAVYAIAEKNAQKARDLLEKAGLDKNDKDIVSPLDALKAQLVSIGRWITDITKAAWSNIKQTLKLLMDGVLSIPKAFIKGIFLIDNAWHTFVNGAIDLINNNPIFKTLGVNFEKTDIAAKQKSQQETLDKIDAFGKSFVDGVTKPLEDTGKAITQFTKDVTYAITEANVDIARAKIRDSASEDLFNAGIIGKELSGLNEIGKGGKFQDVDINGKKYNFSDVLNETLNNQNLSEKDTIIFNQVASQTQTNLKRKLENYETSTKQAETKTNVEREYLIENFDLVKGLSKNDLSSYIDKQINIGKIQKNRELKEEQKQTAIDEIKKGFSENEKKVGASFSSEQRNEIDNYVNLAVESSIKSDLANNYNKNVNDLSSAIGALQNFIKNQSEIGISNNPDAAKALSGFDNTVNLLGDNVNNFAKSLLALKNPEKLANLSPEELQKLITTSPDFASAGNIFSEVQKQIPSIIEQITNNAAQGYLSDEDRAKGRTADTSKADKFREIIQTQITDQFIQTGVSQEQAQNYTKTLLADQKIREQIFALEADDYQKRIELLTKEQQVYETIKQSELLVTKEVLVKSQKLEEQKLQESVKFYQKRLELLRQTANNTDPQIIKDAENDLKNVEQQVIMQRINQKRELLDYESNVIKDTYEKRYAEIEELVLKGETNFTTDERIKFEAEKQQQIIALNVQTQLELRDLLEKEGKLTKKTRLRIEKEIQEQRVNLLRSYIEEAKQRYDNLAENIQKVGDAEANYLNANINKLGVKTEIYDKINQLISQQKSLFDSAQSRLESEASYIRSNLVSRRKQLEFERKYAQQRKRALAEQIAFERQSLEVQQKQNELLIKRLKIEQEIKEKTAKLDLQKALIKEEAVMQDRTSSEADKLTAQTERKIAELNVEAAYINRDNIAAQEVLLNNEIKIKRNEIDQTERQGNLNIKRDLADSTPTRTDNAKLVREAKSNFNISGYNNRPQLDTININVNAEGREQQAREEIEKIKEDTRAKTQPIRDDLKNKQENIDKNLTKLTEDGNSILTNMLNELRILNGKEPSNKTVESESKTEKDDINKVFQRTIKAMLEMTGKQVSEDKLPQLRFADTGDAGGFYYDNTNVVELNKQYQKDIASGEGEGFGVLVHELRHWMQDEGLTNGMMNTDQITDPNERKWAKEVGLNFSGQNAREEDAYAFQTNYDEMLQRIVNNNQVLKGAQTQENVSMSINEILQKQLKIQETILSFVKNFYGGSNPQQTSTQDNKEKSPIEKQAKKIPPKVGEKVDIVSVNKEGKEIGKTGNVRIINKERANEIKAQKELAEKIRRDNNEYYQTLAQLSGVVDTRPDARPQDQIKQLKKFVESQVKQAYKMHTEGKLSAKQTQQFIKDWRTNEKEYAQILQRGVKNPNQEVNKLKKQQEEQRIQKQQQVEKTSGIKDVQQPLKSVQKQIEKEKEVVAQTMQPVTQKPKNIYVGQGYISPKVRNQLGIGAEGKDGRKTDPKTGLALDPAFGWTEDYMPLKKKQGDLNREIDKLWAQYHDKGTHTYEQVQRMAEKNVGWTDKDSYDSKWRLFDVEKKRIEEQLKNPKIKEKERTKLEVEKELLRLRRKDAEARQAAGYTMFDPKGYVMDDETRSRMNILRLKVEGTGLILQPELDIIERERKKGGKNNPYLLNQNTPSFKYQGQQGQILAGLNTNTQNAQQLNNAQNTNNKTNNKNEITNDNKITFSPQVTINVTSEQKDLAKDVKNEINNVLYNLFDDVIRRQPS